MGFALGSLFVHVAVAGLVWMVSAELETRRRRILGVIFSVGIGTAGAVGLFYGPTHLPSCCWRRRQSAPPPSPTPTTTFADRSSDGIGLPQDGDKSEVGRPDARALEELRAEQAKLLACLAAIETAARPPQFPAASTELPRAPEVRDPRHALEALMAFSQGSMPGGPMSQTAAAQVLLLAKVPQCILGLR